MTDGPVFCMNVERGGKPYATGTDSCPPPPTVAIVEKKKVRENGRTKEANRKDIFFQINKLMSRILPEFLIIVEQISV